MVSIGHSPASSPSSSSQKRKQDAYLGANGSDLAHGDEDSARSIKRLKQVAREHDRPRGLIGAIETIGTSTFSFAKGLFARRVEAGRADSGGGQDRVEHAQAHDDEVEYTARLSAKPSQPDHVVASIYPAAPAPSPLGGSEDRPIDISGSPGLQPRRLELAPVDDASEAPASAMSPLPPADGSSTETMSTGSSLSSPLPLLERPARAPLRTVHRSSPPANNTQPTTRGFSRILSELEQLKQNRQATLGPEDTRTRYPSPMTSYPRNRQHSSALNSVERRKAVGGGGQTSQHSRLFDFSKPQEKLTKEDIDEYRRRNIEETPYSYNGKPLAITHFKQPGQQDRPFGSKVKLTSDELRRQKLLRQAQWNRDRAAEQDDISLEALRITDKRADKAVAKKKQLPTQLVGERRAEVDAALRDPRFYSKVARQEASANDIRLLGPGKWLNDEVINFYGAMIQQRADAEKKRKVYFLNSFFWAKLIGQGYEKGKLGKWTKTVNVFDLDILVFPININNNHWVCGAINFKDKRFEYYDSFTSSPPQKVYQTMRNYIQQESRAKRQKDFDFEGWEDYWDHGAPQQQNLYDCGVFTCQTIEHRARGVGDKGQSVTGDNPFEFKQENMEYIRSLMVWEIKHGKLDDRAHSS